MSDSAPVTPEKSTPGAPRSNYNNWISAIGAVLAIGAIFSFAFLLWMDLTGSGNNPYLGIFTYIVAPGFFFTGAAIMIFGAWAQRRWAIKHSHAPDKWRLDFHNPKQRRLLGVFIVGGVMFLMLSAFGSYQSYHIAESNAFCGQVCHTAMNPEYVTYQRSAHARVDCVDCHIGSGALWFVKAKLNGIHQLIAYTVTDYNRPIETPLKNLRPAQDICEKCHWPEKFHGNVEINYEHFLSDRKNTPYTARMLMHVNTNKAGAPVGGIHWHVNKDEKVEYFTADPKRQEIPWMRVTNLKDNTVKVYRTEDFKDEPPAADIRVMDCMDCHNRPAHAFPTANDSVEKSMVTGALSLKLPNIKRVAVQAMTQDDMGTDAEAPGKIEAFLREKYSDPAYAELLPAAIAEVQHIFSVSIYPDRKADWRVYPNNIGHKDWPGCFRCHDNLHTTDQGQAVSSSDCTSCHSILAQGKAGQLNQLSAAGLEFDHPGGELDPDLTCADCHNGGIQQ
ncbi:MAG: NapC/NirT family cytochrome c [Cephaloticoccus sp.]|nr:NapC/NirT family cytochrome c [Cephaloticoccus sp.]MCF7761380.1 NapC/NirT family cytochrome c [Cephaloticoccus sp.]